MRRTKMIASLALALAAISPALTGCAVNPATGAASFNLLSPAEEAQMGREAHAKVLAQFGGPLRDAKINAYVDGLGRKLAATSERKDGPWTFTVLDSPVVNAFALPGGYVYVTRGLLALAGSEAELAGVLAHEIGHVVARHSAERASRGTVAQAGAAAIGLLLGSDVAQSAAELGAAAYVQSYSRDQEFEADSLGVRYLARAGYDPKAMSSLLAKLEAEQRWRAAVAGANGGAGANDDPLSNLFASHPRAADRVAKAAADAEAATPPRTPRKIDAAAYLARIDGMVFGDSPDEGVVRGRQFLHPALRLAFSVPEGFRLENSPERVTAAAADGSALAFDIAAGRDPEAHLAHWARRANLRGVDRVTAHNRPAAVGHATVAVNQKPMAARLVVIEDRPGRLLRFQALAATPARADALAQALLDGLRFLTPAEAGRIGGQRLRVIAAPAGPALERLILAQPVPQPQLFFEAFNGLRAGERPPPGAKIKIVEDAPPR